MVRNGHNSEYVLKEDLIEFLVNLGEDYGGCLQVLWPEQGDEYWCLLSNEVNWVY